MTREITVEDRALINYMKKSIAKGIPVGQSLRNFADMYGDTLKRVNSRWYYGNKQEHKGISLRDICYREEGIFPYKKIGEKEPVKINTSRKEVSDSNQKQKLESSNEIYDKIDSMHNDMVKYIGNIETSVEKEIKAVVDTIGSLYENTLALRNLQFPKSKRDEPSYQINGKGEVKKIAPVQEVSFSEKKVNAIINDLDKAEDMNKKYLEEIRLLKNDKLSLEREVEEVNSTNRTLNSKIRNLEVAGDNLINNQQKESKLLKKTIQELRDTVNKQRLEIEEISNRSVVERLFNKKKI